MITAYHGSDTKFSKFDPQKIGGSNGTNNGFGFYFSDNEDEASTYGKYVYEVQLNIRNLISDTKKTLSRPVIKKLLDNLAKIECNYYQNFDYNVKATIDSLLDSCDTDTEIIGDVINAVGSIQDVLLQLSKMGYSHTINLDTFALNSVHYVMFDPNDIKIVKVTKIR